MQNPICMKIMEISNYMPQIYLLQILMAFNLYFIHIMKQSHKFNIILSTVLKHIVINPKPIRQCVCSRSLHHILGMITI